MIVSLEMRVLKCVLLLGPGAYSSAIAGALNYAAGSIHITLQRMVGKGWLTSTVSAPIPRRGGRAKRIYAVTEDGCAALNEIRAKLVAQRSIEGSMTDKELKALVADFNLLNDLKAFMRLFEKTHMIDKATVPQEGMCAVHAQFLINRIVYGSDLPPEGKPNARLTKHDRS